ncbi:MAG: hypothetical protein IPJ65_41650 [Archangiaceae bacterium]|nr:hypothetical protein [Archangiaceae bacterium]
MDLPIHDQILWQACVLAEARLGGSGLDRPTKYFPLLSRGSWLNDTNQVSCFTDFFSNPKAGHYVAAVDDRTHAFFVEYWAQKTDEVVGRLARRDAGLAADAMNLCRQLTSAADFGTYTNHDHLDVLLETDQEYDGTNVARTVKGSLDSIATRLEMSTLVDTSRAARLAPVQASALGRALHSIADFFAHTNYVELLLWAVHERGHLAEPLVALMNCDPRVWPFDPALARGVYTPLDRPSSVDPDQPLLPGWWQADSAAQTPLVSTVFDKQDTTCSLLSLYSRYLESMGTKVSTERELDLVFSIIDVSGAPLTAGALRLFARVDDVVTGLFQSMGRAARNMLAGWLDGRGDAFAAGANLLRTYDGAEAAQWARAGRMRYLGEAVRAAMAQKLARELNDPSKKPLPHHTLLSKDHPPDRADEQVRFSLACHLATELSARVLEWHFGSAVPDEDGFERLRRRFLLHPSDQLGSAFEAKKLAPLLERCTSSAWPMLAKRDVRLEAFAP